MTFIIRAQHIIPGINSHYYMGTGMWSSEIADAKHYETSRDAGEDISGSTFASLSEIVEVVDAPEEP